MLATEAATMTRFLERDHTTRKTSRHTTFRHFVAACSVALLVTGGSMAALAHGGGGGGAHHERGNHNMAPNGSNAFGGRNIDGAYWSHHHHHPGNGPGGLGAVHGPGSSHNPIVYHPPVRPVRPPVAGVGPAKLPRPVNLTFCQFQESGGVLRDHRSNSDINGPCPRLPHHH
jgi:hypothetical protein